MAWRVRRSLIASPKAKICASRLSWSAYRRGRGSERPPVLLALDYNPTGDKEAPVYACLVGKGITFDSGGYSIKQSAFYGFDEVDMGGAATITGALAFAITRGLNKRVKLYLCCADNLISGNASNWAILFIIATAKPLKL